MDDLIQFTRQSNAVPADFLTGRLLRIDKPQGWTSFDVVNKTRFALRHRLGIRKIKVGHSGTLDPMATGLLIVCTGKYTKALHQLQGLDKTYTGEITLGAKTPTYDAESEPDQVFPVDHLTHECIHETAEKFQGLIEQVPPVYSAIKQKGVAAYKLARRGKEVTLEPRTVRIHSFRISAIDLPRVRFVVHCSKGFYVRSLAHDLGLALGVGGHLTKLRRHSIGPYTLDGAWEMDLLGNAIRELPDPPAKC